MEKNFVFQMQEVRVCYGRRSAVDSLSLSLERGRSLGMLGPNGAGKTSTLRAILGMVKPRRGQISVMGGPPGDPKNFQKIGFAPEEGSPPEFLTAPEYLSLVAEFKIHDRAKRKEEIGDLVQLFELPLDKKIRDYSKGMKRRVVLAQTFLGHPELLVLDEPLNGLDPLLIIKLRKRLEDYMKDGGSLVFSSHILAEVEKTCSVIAILREGSLLCSASTSELVSRFGSIENAFASYVGKEINGHTP